MATTLIHGGTVVSATGCRAADVLINGQRISALFEPGGADAMGVVADRRIDATGKYVVPGGVDVHTHMQLPVSDTMTSSDTFETGSIAAAWGGVTTIVDFAQQTVGERVQETLARRHAEAAAQCAIDYAFHQVIGDVDDESLKAMDELVEHEGVTSFKMFMAYPGRLYADDGQILRAMQRANELGAVVMMHAENGIAIDVLVAQAIARGDTDPAMHSLTRPPELEGEATNRAIQLARVAGNCPLYIVHLSAAQALERVAAARHEGANVFAETCPQYLYLSLEDHLMRPDGEGAKWVCSTPLRSHHEHHQRDLWTGLRTNDLAVVSTDHCPFCFNDQKDRGMGSGRDFSMIPNGIGGVEHRMELMYQGVVTGEISLERWVETCSTTPARMFGLADKGVIEAGADADVLVWDPEATTVIGVEADDRKHHMNMDHSAYEGIEIAGAVDTVLSRGEVVVGDGAFHGRPGHGRFVKRGLSRYVR